jgi:hypothetical protein
VVKKIVFVLFTLLLFALSGPCFAEENPFKGLTQDQVIQEYFEGRQLDPFEGIWVDYELKPWVNYKGEFN